MPTAEMSEKVFTVKEAAMLLNVSVSKLKYAFRTRPHVARRYAGNVMLVTLNQCRQALNDVGPYQRRWTTLSH